ncbi:hypothetical protein [Iodobacter ciconiae]|uniref:Uncharacterized protein n=1 Tax=Iodobacter ciconiae TaxID=2496266 RepID=A0A3S8ZR93_9NEIS|nr:hypothetical protein [Iodobacter ciconiae]AZN35935.1 hypothetical protein EJO50_05225 [Iodobacter ciconiae]
MLHISNGTPRNKFSSSKKTISLQVNCCAVLQPYCTNEKTPNTVAAKVNQELETFFEQYDQAYSNLDPHATSSMFALPFMTVHQGQGTAWETMDLRLPATAGLLNWFKQQGFMGASYKIEDVLYLDAHFASVKLI